MIKKLSTFLTVLFTCLSLPVLATELGNKTNVRVEDRKIILGTSDSEGETGIYQQDKKLQFLMPTNDGTSFIQFLNSDGAEVFSISSSGIIQSDSDHGDLNATSLTHDDHSGYPWMDGRAGGQTLIGSTLTDENITLHSNTLKNGLIKFGDNSFYDENADTLVINDTTATGKITVKGTTASVPLVNIIKTSLDAGDIFKIEDENDPGSFFTIQDATGSASFIPSFVARTTLFTVPSLYFVGNTSTGGDVGSKPLIRMSGRIDNSTVVNRPLFSVANVNSDKVVVLADGSTGFGTLTPTANVHAKGTGNTSATYNCKFQNSDGTNVLSCRDDGLVTIDNQLDVATLNAIGSVREKVTTVSTATHTLASNENVISVTYTSGAVLTLPSASTVWDATNGTGIAYLIMDSGNSAGANPHTINRAGTDTIIDASGLGKTSTQITSNGGAIHIMLINSTTWQIF